jgi:FHA domain
MIRCFYCDTDNLDGSEYCDECGKKLNASAATSSPNYVPPPPQLSRQIAPPPPPSFTKETITPKPATPYTPPPPPVQPIDQRTDQKVKGQARERTQGKDRSGMQDQATQLTQESCVAQHPNQTIAFNGPTGSLRDHKSDVDSSQQQAMNFDDTGQPKIRAKLIIQRGGKIGKEFPIIGNESMIGRWDADGGIFPDVDLDQDDPEAKVSRRHARIQYANNQYLIEDLGSTNGTFINRGPRLLPGNKQPLNNGDEIIVGKTFLKFVLN